MDARPNRRGGGRQEERAPAAATSVVSADGARGVQVGRYMCE